MIFEPLLHDRRKEIVKIQMKTVIDRVAAKSISLFASDAALDVILSESSNLLSMTSFAYQMIMPCVSLYVLVTINALSLADVRCKAHKEVGAEECEDCAIPNAGQR